MNIKNITIANYKSMLSYETKIKYIAIKIKQTIKIRVIYFLCAFLIFLF